MAQERPGNSMGHEKKMAMNLPEKNLVYLCPPKRGQHALRAAFFAP